MVLLDAYVSCGPPKSEMNLCTGCCSLDFDFASLFRQQQPTLRFYNSIVLFTLDNTEFIYSWLAWVPTSQVLISTALTGTELVPNQFLRNPNLNLHQHLVKTRSGTSTWYRFATGYPWLFNTGSWVPQNCPPRSTRVIK